MRHHVCYEPFVLSMAPGNPAGIDAYLRRHEPGRIPRTVKPVISRILLKGPPQMPQLGMLTGTGI